MTNRPVRPTAGRGASGADASPSAGRPLRGRVPLAEAAGAQGTGAQGAVRRARPGVAPSGASAPVPEAGRRAVRGAAGVVEQPPQRSSSRAAMAAATPETAAKQAQPQADKPRDMVSAIEELERLLQEENECLRQHQLETVNHNIERKQQLTRAYMQQMIAFKKNPGLLESLPEERRQDLKDALTRLKPMIDDNGRMLKAKIESINRFMGVVVEAVRDEKSKSAVTYGTSGAMDGGCVDNRHMAVALNQEL